MGFFLRFLLIAVLGFLIIRSIKGLLSGNSKPNKDFQRNKSEIKNDDKDERNYKGGEYVDYEEVD